MTDNLSPRQRSFCMSRVRGKDTRPERLLRSALHARGLRFRKHVRALPGTPDVVFPGARVVVFVDGRFWHGYRLGAWRSNLDSFWRRKITLNRARDQRNFRRLRRLGWQVVRIWDHELRRDLTACVRRVAHAVRGHERVLRSG